MAGAVGDPVEVLGVAAHGLEDHAEHGDVAPTARRRDIALLIAMLCFLQPNNKVLLLHSSTHFDIETKRTTRQTVAITKGLHLSYIKKLLKDSDTRLIRNQINC